jgi:hypothetical protein
MLSFCAAGLALAVPVAAAAQQPPTAAESVVDAAQNARDQKSAAAKQTRVLTNDDLVPPTSVLSGATTASPARIGGGESAGKTPAAAPLTAAQSANCDNPDDERREAELQALEEERDQLRRQLNADPPVISGGNVDMSNFKQGNSGVAFGSPPLSQTQPQSAERISEVELNEKIASLERATKIACDSPEDAGIQRQLDDAEQHLKWLERQFALDQNTYYSKPDYKQDTAGKANLDAEQEQIDRVQSDIDRLKQELSQQSN